MSSWQSGFIDVQGIKLHYTRTGGAKPPVVLAHGVTDNGLCWTPTATVLAEEYDVIMVDARGHGESDAPLDGYDSVAQAADLAGLITGLELHKPVVIGHSMGAMTTLVLAGNYPTLAEAIILEDPPGMWVPRGPITATDGERMAGMLAWFRSVKSKSREQLIAEQRSSAIAWPEAEFGPWADAKQQVSPNVFRMFEPDAPPPSVDWAAILPKITCPALLLTADQAYGAALTPEGVKLLQGWVPQLVVTNIAGAGHNIRREQFDRFIEAIRPFLAKYAKN